MDQNSNCLKDFGCPHCMSQGPFQILTGCSAIWTDDGVDTIQEPEMDEAGTTLCLDCHMRFNTAEVGGIYRGLRRALMGDLGYIRDDPKLRQLAKEGFIPMLEEGKSLGSHLLVGVVDPQPAIQPLFNLGCAHRPDLQIALLLRSVSRPVMDKWLELVKGEFDGGEEDQTPATGVQVEKGEE